MTKGQLGALIGVLLTALIGVLGVFGYQINLQGKALSTLQAALNPPVAAATRGAYQVPCHTEVGGAGYTCDEGGTISVTSGGALSVASGASATFAGTTAFGGTTTFTTAPTLTGLPRLTAGSVITVTNGVAFTVTATMQPIAAAGAVTPTLTIPAAGVAACVYNTTANVITLADSSNQVLTAAAALGQYDMLCGYSDGTRFIETSRANN